MLELTHDQYPSILPLLATSKQPVVPFSVCQGYNPGRVSPTTRPDHAAPGLAILRLPVSGGRAGRGLVPTGPVQPAHRDARPGLGRCRRNRFILAPFSNVWESRIAQFLDGRPHERIYRRRFTFDAARFAAWRDWATHVPPGFEMRRVDVGLARALGGLVTWASIQDFLHHGLGYCLLKDGEIASACTSVFATPSGVEIDVHTAEACRRQGLATAGRAALIASAARRAVAQLGMFLGERRIDGAGTQAGLRLRRIIRSITGKRLPER